MVMSQDVLLRQYKELANETDDKRAFNVLSANHWNLDAALRNSKYLRPTRNDSRPYSGEYDNLQSAAQMQTTGSIFSRPHMETRVLPSDKPPPRNQSQTKSDSDSSKFTNLSENLHPTVSVPLNAIRTAPLAQQECVPQNSHQSQFAKQDVVSGSLNVQATKEASVSPNTQRRLHRGFSNTQENMGIIKKAQNVVLTDLLETGEESQLIETPETSFVLPDLSRYSADFQTFIFKELLEYSTLNSLQSAGRLNWWVEPGVCQQLWPLATSGDGNCLLHAASLAMWGFHDRNLTLRTALNHMMSQNTDMVQAMYRRWRYQQTINNTQTGLELSENEWQTEWSNLLKLSSTMPRKQPGSRRSCCDSPVTKSSEQRSSLASVADVYESLEELHVFVLAHVLRRPILVLADTVLRSPDGEAIAPIPFGGIYLPLEVRPEDCYRRPLMLTYDSSHFSALVTMIGEADTLPALVPLVDPNLELLPLHFPRDPGEGVRWDHVIQKKDTYEEQLSVLRRYLHIVAAPAAGRQHTLQRRGSDRSSSSSGSSVEKKPSRSVGSLGKSVGKKIKKKLGVTKKDKLSKGKSDHRPLTLNAASPVVSPSSSKDTMSSTVAAGRKVICAVLDAPKPDHWHSMVDNYIATEQKRYAEELATRKQQMAKQKPLPKATTPTIDLTKKCITPSCTGYGNSSTSYLCLKCYNLQKQAISSSSMGASRSGNKPGTALLNPANTYGPQGNHVWSGTTVGHSKFYTDGTDGSTSLNNSSAPPEYSQIKQLPNIQQNIPNTTKPQPMRPTQVRSQAETKPCKNPHCTFFGTPATNYYCSRCFKESSRSTKP